MCVNNRTYSSAVTLSKSSGLVHAQMVKAAALSPMVIRQSTLPYPKAQAVGPFVANILSQERTIVNGVAPLVVFTHQYFK